MKFKTASFACVASLFLVSARAEAQEQSSRYKSVALATDQLLKNAEHQLGIPYVRGGTDPNSGFDCSGLIRYLLATIKVEVPRNARAQALTGRTVPRDIKQLRVGDLLTFGYGSKVSHIGIYVGSGKFIHASTGTHSVVESLLQRPAGRGIKPWIGARRLALVDAH